MCFRLGYRDEALKEWHKLESGIREQFKSKLIERQDRPHVPAAEMSGHLDPYEIKLRSVEYRLVYEVQDTEVIVVVVTVGKRERNAVYLAAAKRT